MIKCCPVCGESFEAKRGGRKYCSQICYRKRVKENALERHRALHGRLEDRECVHCGKTFHPRAHNQEYCSGDCRRLATNTRNRKTDGTYIPPRQCRWCDTLFQSEDKEKLYCCKQCEEDALRFEESKIFVVKRTSYEVAQRRKEHARITAAARAQKTSYGIYVALMNEKEEV